MLPKPQPHSPVRTARLRAGLTQVQLSARSGVSVVVIGMAERWQAVTLRTAERLAPVLGVQAADLMPRGRR